MCLGTEKKERTVFHHGTDLNQPSEFLLALIKQNILVEDIDPSCNKAFCRLFPATQ
jgi:hypothetical protein